LFMTLLAAFHTLLYRYTGQESINVGAPVANRTHVEMEQLIGFFVNTLVLNGRFPDNITFRQLLRQLRQTVLDAFSHQDVPFEMLVETLQTERDMSRTPLFQVMFDLQKAPPETIRFGNLEACLLETEPSTAKFDLLLMVLEREDGLEAIFEYNTDLFAAATIQRMAGHFQTLLAGIVAEPDQPVAALPLLTEEELRQILLDWNDTARPYPQDKTFAQLFAAQVEKTPEATAVFYEGASLTYDQLNRKANQLAHRLQKLGAKPGDLVGLAVDRSLDMLVGIVGILKSGAAYLPLDPTYPRDRLAFMLADAQVHLLVTQTEQLAALTAENLTTICLDGDAADLAQEAEDNPANAAGPEDTAYVIYTSGSTGQPKGVMIPHRAMLHLSTALHQVVYDDRIPDGAYRISLNAPISFDASVQQIVMLLHGCALHIIPQEARQDGAALLAYIRRHRLHALDCVPSQLKLLLEAGLLDGEGWTLEKALPGGEAIDETTWQQLQNAPHTQFYNMYGPTECAVDAVIAPVKTAGLRPVIGRPVPNNQIYILDKNRQPVPVGVPGEIYIGGAGVGKGYLHQPELTAERFIQLSNYQLPSPVYHTGDLGRYLPDGNI
ncbi:MAG TPA: amino acid adenylation domain-containing protein, partial [Anaerolineae bacterium]|nr:amino acid adenylation domain-containing protein [Anaerolineae bacterium]